ncbi:MAG: hypothetical protein IPK97_00125 [Ahniella sp.]|nr:hypothetical protein [Ahniella sp.]
MSTNVAQRMITRTTAFARYLALLRQYNTVHATIASLSVEERRKIATTAMSELTRAETSHVTPTTEEVSDYAVQAAVAFPKVRSSLWQIKESGIRRWLVSAYRATANSPYGEVQSLHRQVMRALRTMNELNKGSGWDVARIA